MSTVTVVSIALLGVLLFLLGANVTRQRAIRAGGNQQPTDPADRLLIAIRAHGNAAEYVPTLIVLVLVCSALSDGWWVDVLAVAALASRVLHAAGMLTAKTLASHGPLRDAGAMGTYLVGLNVVESWNRGNSIIFYGKGGNIATNRRDEQELSVLCLRVLQAALVYVNTLMVQDVLADDAWVERLNAADQRGLNPLFWTHVAPYGEVRLNMQRRLSLRTEEQTSR